MKILLIEPAKSPSTIGGEDIFLYEPLALEYLAAGLSPEHDTRILDLRLDSNLDRALADFQPDVVGITAYTVHVNPVRALFEKVKIWNPDVLTVVGGHHATLSPRDLATPFVDLIVRGEGVAPLRDIVWRLQRGHGYDGIPGVCHRMDDGTVADEPAMVTDLDSLPFPRRDLTGAYRKSYFSEWMRPLASMRTSKGCPHRCNFCALWKLSDGRYLRRSPESVLEELAGIDEPYVFFADDESLYDTQRMRRLAELIRSSGLRKRFFLYARSDTIVRAPDLLEAWREVGLERVFVGLEFFSDRDLDYVSKGSTIADNERAVALLKSLDIEIYASFIVRPDFTREDFGAFQEYVRSLKLNFVSFSVLTPLPGTDLYEEVKDRLIDRDFDHFDFIHTLLPTALPLKQFYEQYYRLYTHALPLQCRLTILRKIPLRDLPALQVRSARLLRRLRTAYRDY
ncbi:MAG: radical SAM protein [bacterium]